MASKTTEENRELVDPPREQKLEELYALIEKIEITMMVTHTAEGAMVSRPMSTQKRVGGVDLWFMTTTEGELVEQLRADPRVALAYYSSKSREWVSVAGRARLVADRATIRARYQPDWRAWLGDEGGARDGGPDDPRIGLIEVEGEHATYFRGDVPRAVALFRVLKGVVTGEPPKVGVQRELSATELRRQ